MARQFAVFFFAATALLCEILLFHATKYVLDYILAMAVISCAVAGIGLGAYLASRWSWSDRNLFSWCCGGTAASLYLAAAVLLGYPNLFLLFAATASVFVCPSYFIAGAFAHGSPRGIYLFDMLGAGMAVLCAVSAYQWLTTEAIFLAVVTILPLVGAAAAAIGSTYRGRRRAAFCAALLVCAGLSGTLLHQQVTRSALSIARLVNPTAPNIPQQSVLRRPSRLRIERTYDSLVGRIEALPGKDRIFVTYDGFFNDSFTDYKAHDYAQYAGPHNIRLPAADFRVVYGLVPAPRAFVIGPATTGIVKTLREITPLENIDAVEINPGVLQMMQHDYLAASGEAYRDLHVVPGNALSVLRRSAKQYDLITLINAHSSRWIGSLGPPDYLHTRESYDMYFDHLSEDGYLLFEERPDTYRGELGVKRMIHTLWDCLQRRGVRDPAAHFFIWEYMSQRYRDKGLTGIAPGSDMYYVCMVVSLKPLVGQRRADVLEWCDLEWTVRWEDTGPVYVPCELFVEPAYLKGQWHGERFGPFFEMLAADDFSGLGQDFDASILTRDRPFSSCATRSLPEVSRLLVAALGVCLLLGGLFSVGAMRGIARRGRMGLLVGYNVAIGCAYFFIEIVLIQAYQNVFLSPSASLVLVMGVLLIGSAIGGLLSNRVRLWWATAALVPVLVSCLQVPAWTLPLDPHLAGLAAVAMIFLVGMNMGIYFPSGLLLAERWSLRGRIPHLFAINALAGSLATVVSLCLAIRIGYTWTLIGAFMLYVAATIAYNAAVRESTTVDFPGP
jgi:hypothetical protein